MGQLVDILANSPHMQGKAVCLNCNHTWQAVAPVGTTWLHCTRCETDKGVWNGIAQPNEPLWECECKCSHFFITELHAYCCHCGLAQAFGDPRRAG